MAENRRQHLNAKENSALKRVTGNGRRNVCGGGGREEKEGGLTAEDRMMV